MRLTNLTLIGITTGAFIFSSCTPTQQTYALGGAAAGAAVGAIAGGDSEDILTGAALGGATGAGVAAYQENKERSRSSPVSPHSSTTTPPPVPPSNANGSAYKKAFATDTPGIVISPYSPYNKVNVGDFSPGTLAKDPTTGKIFVVPD